MADRSLTVRPYRVTLRVFEQGEPRLTSLEPGQGLDQIIELDAYDAADALLQSGVQIEAQLALFSEPGKLTIKAMQVQPNPPVVVSPGDDALYTAANVRRIVEAVVKTAPPTNVDVWDTVEMRLRRYFERRRA